MKGKFHYFPETPCISLSIFYSSESNKKEQTKQT